MRATQKESDGSPVSPAAAALALVPMIGELREEIEDGRCLPAALVDSMVQANLFQLGLPAVVGGPQHHPLTSFAAIETLARAEGAVGWCASIASSVSLVVGAWLAPEVVRAMVGAPPDLRVAGSVRAEGEAKKVEGGYRLSGRWDFASGIDHANWLYCSCRVINLTDAEDKPETRTLMVPRDEGSRIDTWTAAGMRGSGSHDFAVTDVFVSDARVITAGAPPRNDALLYHPRLVRISGWTTTAAVALGIARGALDALTDLSIRGTTMSTATLRERPAVQQAAGEAEAILGGARAYLTQSVAAAFDAVDATRADPDAPDPGPAVARARLAITHAMHEAVRCVDIVFRAAGTLSVYRRNRIERCFRDAHVACQHAAGMSVHFQTAGKSVLGFRLNEPGW